jgi:hypothetical protein
VIGFVFPFENLRVGPQVESWPRQIDDPISELTIHEDGILCLQCNVYTCRQIRTMKAHWLEEHGYRVQQGRGRGLLEISYIGCTCRNQARTNYHQLLVLQ